jgi:hypothetical protein
MGKSVIKVKLDGQDFWNVLYSQSSIPIELKLAGFNHLHENSWYTEFGYDPMKLEFLVNLGQEF